MYNVVSGHALVKCGRGEFELHPGDQVVVPSTPAYTVINNGSDTLILEPVKPAIINCESQLIGTD